jgi:hypothetical protein
MAEDLVALGLEARPADFDKADVGGAAIEGETA